jgi:hypothetical protein
MCVCACVCVCNLDSGGVFVHTSLPWRALACAQTPPDCLYTTAWVYSASMSDMEGCV